MFGLLYVAGRANPVVSFTDPGLEAAVREKVGKADGVILLTDVRSITELDASGKGIRSLEGLAVLSKLVSLNLEDNQVNDLIDLSELPMLKMLNLRNNGITDLKNVNFEAISNMQLRELNLRHNVRETESGEIRLSDISLLEGLRKLEVLELRDNEISDISSLSRLNELIRLDLSQNTIGDFTPLSGLQKLTELNLRETGITDIEFLRKMPDLMYLNLHSNSGITSVEPVGELTALNTLILEGVPVGDKIGMIGHMENLTRLNLTNTGIDSIDVLRGMEGITHLELSGNALRDIEPISEMKDMEVLSLGHTGITDIEAAGGFIRMKELDLRNNRIEDLTPLEGMTSLTYLNLHSNRNIRSISPLGEMLELETLILRNVPVGEQTESLNELDELKILNLSNTGIADISPLKGAMKLTHLEMNQNDIEDITPLSGMTELKILDLGENRIENVDALRDHVHISELDLRGNEIKDIDPIRGLSDLRYLNLKGNGRIRSVEAIAELLKLETLILKDVPIGDQYHIFENLIHLQRVNVENTGILDESVFARLEEKGSLVRDEVPEYGVYTTRAPLFSRKGGLYGEAFTLELSTDEPSGEVFYTLNGSEPTKSSHRYTDPLTIPMDQVSVVRATVYTEEGEYSPVITNTYFLNPQVFERSDLPFISIATKESSLFDPETGIYTEKNRWMAGRDWERPIHIEMYEDSGELLFRQNAGIRIHGAYTRTLHQKSFKIFARPEYDNQNHFNGEIFPGLKDMAHGEVKNKFKRLIIRTSGNDYNGALFRDGLIQSLVAPLKTLTTQAYRPAVLFVNGRYWGIHNIREMYGTHYLSSTFDVEEEDVVILENDRLVDEGLPEDVRHYQDMLDYIRANGLKSEEHYDYIRTQMDVENFRDYLIAETFFGNTDWPHNNVRYWRTKTDEYRPDAPYGRDGRWRWMLYDMDFGFSRHFIRTDRFGSTMDHTHDTLTWALSEYDGLYGALSWPNYLFRAVMENETFRQDFISRYADLMNSYFNEELMEERIDLMKEPIEPEIRDHIRRWGFSYDYNGWQQVIIKMKEFSRERATYMRQHLIKRFKLGQSADITLLSDAEKGYIKINTIEIRDGLPGYIKGEKWRGTYFSELPVTLTAVAEKGFRFSHWEGVEIDTEAEVISLMLTEDMEIRAVFTPTED